MKKIVLSLSLFVLNVSAASTGWMTTNRHEARGVKFVLKTEHSLTPRRADLYTDFFSHALTLTLHRGMGFHAAKRSIKSLIEDCEAKVCKEKKKLFFNEMYEVEANDQAHSSSQGSLHPVYAIHKILLEATLREKDPDAKIVKLKLSGEAVPGECCSFFPPYTIAEQQESDSEGGLASVDYEAACFDSFE